MEATALEGQAIRPTISLQHSTTEIGDIWQWHLMSVVVNSFTLQSISTWSNLI